MTAGMFPPLVEISDQEYAKAWDLWWASLPRDLRQKLSFDDFRRLGGLFFGAFESFRRAAVENERDACAALAEEHRPPGAHAGDDSQARCGMSAESPRRCACPQLASARECLRVRYPQPFGFGDEDDRDEITGDEERCECICHEEQRAEDEAHDYREQWE